MTQHLLFPTQQQAQAALAVCNQLMRVVAARNGYQVIDAGIVGNDVVTGEPDPRGVTTTVAEIHVYPDGRHGFQSPISTYQLDVVTAANLTANFEALYGTDYEVWEGVWPEPVYEEES